MEFSDYGIRPVVVAPPADQVFEVKEKAGPKTGEPGAPAPTKPAPTKPAPPKPAPPKPTG
ncbi:MAG TPA: hypothetical protein VFU43_17790 [Streptosporangiaceae bacterium]|nr:hypothetical protein [Streptosporangiaceae bacterium]